MVNVISNNLELFEHNLLYGYEGNFIYPILFASFDVTNYVEL